MVATWIIWMVYRTRNGTLQVSKIIHPQDKRRTNIRHSRIPPQNISFPTDAFHGCNLSFRTRSNICNIEFRTCKNFSKIRVWAQGSIEDPSRYIQKSKPPNSISKGARKGGRPKETPISEPGINPNEKDTVIKSIHQYRTSEGDYFRGIPR